MIRARDVAQQLGVSVGHVHALRREGRLPGYDFGGAIRFDPADVAAYIESCKCQSATTRKSKATARH